MDSIEKRIGYSFENPRLLSEALTHPSLAYENQDSGSDNQRLEFLGDAVLQLVLTYELFTMFPDFSEGHLTKLRSRLVSTEALEEYALGIDLGTFVLLGKGEERTGGRSRQGVLADAFEALIGAVYLDSGFESAKGFILNSCKIKFAQIVAEPIEKNPKGELQEVLQKISQFAPTYRVLNQEGPDHDCSFETEVLWDGRVLGVGQGKNKKESERSAAQNALVKSLWIDTNSSQ
ncbi:MAG: ribonuclease III [Verrucomicrobiales bacterium]|jgi:ribonuclease-3|nr:ribonuclease III [Verrucomicrobiales bacterium]